MEQVAALAAARFLGLPLMRRDPERDHDSDDSTEQQHGHDHQQDSAHTTYIGPQGRGLSGRGRITHYSDGATARLEERAVPPRDR